jgi:hypothetical protein
MTNHAGHIREINNVNKATSEALELVQNIENEGFNIDDPKELIRAVQAKHLCVASLGYLSAISELLKAGSGSRGSHLVIEEKGIEIHPDIKDPDTGRPLRFKPEKEELKNTVMRIIFDKQNNSMFNYEKVPVRERPMDRKAFEPGWTDYRQGKIYKD